MAGKSKLKIGYLTSMMTNALSKKIWKGICDTLRKDDEALCFVGGALKQTFPQWVDVISNMSFDLASEKNLDGIIIYGGAIGQYVSDEEMSEFINRYKGVPIVNISTVIPGITSIVPSNYSGMYKIVEHLIEEHSFRNIVFIKGPEGHFEAEERYKAYRDALEKSEIPFCEEYIFPGGFTKESGQKAVEEIYDQRHLDVDAIVAVDDETAVGAIHELQNRGILIPDDVSVVGFDDSDMAICTIPTLSTVNQPFYRMGVDATRIIMAKIRGEQFNDIIEFDSEPVIRQSCGCFTEFDFLHEEKKVVNLKDFNLIEAYIVRVLGNRNGLNPNQIHRLLSELSKTLESQEGEYFLHGFNLLLSELRDLKEQLPAVKKLLRVILARFSVYVERQLQDYLKDLIQKAIILLYSAAENVEIAQRINIEDLYLQQNLINQTIHQAVSFHELFDSCFKYLPKIGVKSCSISLFADHSFKTCRLVFAYDETGRKEIRAEDSEFLAYKLLPDNYSMEFSTNNRIICTLGFNAEAFGFVVFEISQNLSELSHILSWHFSSIIKRLYVLEEQEEKNFVLKNTLSELKNMQKKLVEAEKLASLGNLIAGVSHEINTPLGIGITYSSFIEDRVSELVESLNSGSIKRSQLNDFVISMAQASRSLTLNLKKVSLLVQSFKNVAVNSSDNKIKRFDICTLIDETVLSLRNHVERDGHKINFCVEHEIIINNYPGPLNQILIELINNSVLHGFAKSEQGQIFISVSEVGDQIELIYSDDGCGMIQDHQSRIFEPFFTTKRGDGSVGLGLHVVYNLITQILQGTIECSARKPSGVKFKILFPGNNPQVHNNSRSKGSL